MQMYSQEDGVTFGYHKDENDKTQFKYNILENYRHGRYCKSGLATINYVTKEMQCVTMSKLETNKYKETGFVTKHKCNEESQEPKSNNCNKCNLGTFESPDRSEACKYFYTDKVSGESKLIS